MFPKGSPSLKYPKPTSREKPQKPEERKFPVLRLQKHHVKEQVKHLVIGI
jgi:hypothetical protein